MLHADPASRRRIQILASVILVLLGGFLLSGVLQRVLPKPRMETDAPTQEELAQFRRDAKEVRDLRDKLAGLAKEGHWSAAVEAADTFLKRRENVLILRMRAEALLRTGDQVAAARDFAGLFRDLPMDQASLLALKGDVRGYRRHCAAWVRRIDPERLGPLEANNFAWMCALAPDGLEDYGVVSRLSARAVEQARPEERATYLNTLGAVQYRAGQYGEAITALTEADSLRKDPFNWVFLAMAHQRLGQAEEARTWLDRLQKYLDASYGMVGDIDSRHELLMFWREAQTLIDPAPAG